MKELTSQSHNDYIDVIGNTVFTTKNYRERLWNKYYFSRNRKAVLSLIRNDGPRESILDLGYSYGGWYKTWRDFGFKEIYGVELSSERAKLAKEAGYTNVYNCEGKTVPVKDSTFQFVCSNGVFIHILQLKDKLDVMNEAFRILKPGGCLVFNFVPPLAHGYNKNTIKEYRSYYTLDTMIRDVILKTRFKIEDIKPSYYPKYSLFRKIIGLFIIFPFAVPILKLHDLFVSHFQSIELSSTIYIKSSQAFYERISLNLLILFIYLIFIFLFNSF